MTSTCFNCTLAEYTQCNQYLLLSCLVIDDLLDTAFLSLIISNKLY